VSTGDDTLHLPPLDSVLPWALTAVCLVILLIQFFRKRPSKTPPAADIWGSEVVLSLRAQLKQQQEMVKDQMEFFINFPEVVKILTGAFTVDEVTSAMSRGISALVGSRRVGIFLAHADNRLRLSDGAGFRREFRGTFTCPLKTPELLPILKYRSVSSMKDHPSAVKFLEPLTLEPSLAAPIWYGDRLLGLLVISAPTLEMKAGCRIFAMLADLMSVNLHATSAAQEIRKKAERDTLTGLLSRSALLSRVQTETARCTSYNSKFSLVIIDVDHLNYYNDRNGRAIGDEALKKTASLILSALRRTDTAARYDGGKFALVLQNSSREEAGRTAERMRSTIAQGEFLFGQFQPLGNISVSIGAAVFPEDAKDSESLFLAAEEALLEAKKSGRNRVQVFDRRIQIE
jgi:diguanylate cyclase (GGDEF)-like protein